MVEIQVAKRIRGLARFRALQRPLQPRFELGSVDEARQDVVTGVVTQAAVQFARFADVVEDQHAAGDIAFAIANRRGGAFDIQLVAVAADEQCRAHGLDRAAATYRYGQGVLEGFAGLFVETAEYFIDGTAARIVDLPAGQLLGDRIDVFDVALGIGRDDAVADRAQGNLRALFLTEQRFFI